MKDAALGFRHQLPRARPRPRGTSRAVRSRAVTINAGTTAGTQFLDVDVRHPDHLDQALALHLRERTHRLRDRHAWIDGVQLVEVDRLKPKQLQALLELGAERRRGAVG